MTVKTHVFVTYNVFIVLFQMKSEWKVTKRWLNDIDLPLSRLFKPSRRYLVDGMTQLYTVFYADTIT